MTPLVPGTRPVAGHALSDVVAGAGLAPATVPVSKLLAVSADALELHGTGVEPLPVSRGNEIDGSSGHGREATPVASALLASLVADADGHQRDVRNVADSKAPHTRTLREGLYLTPEGVLTERASL